MAYLEYEVPVSGTIAGKVVRRPDPLEPGKLYPLIIVTHGIVERGSGSDLDLDKLRTTGSLYSVESAGAYHNCILVEPQADVNWEHGEIDEARDWALQNLPIDLKKIYGTGLSLGGGGWNRYMSRNPNWRLKFAAIAPMCAGPNQFFITNADGYTNIANSLKEGGVWYHHCADDTTVHPYESTLKVLDHVLKINANAHIAVSVWKTGGHTGGWKSYNRYTNTTKDGTSDEFLSSIAYKDENGVTKTFKLLNDPALNIFQWFLQNEIGKPIVMPARLSDTAPAPTPAPTVSDVIVKSFILTGEPRPQTLVASAKFSDNSPAVLIKAPTNDLVDYVVPSAQIINGVTAYKLYVKYKSGVGKSYGPTKSQF